MMFDIACLKESMERLTTTMKYLHENGNVNERGE